MRILLVSSQDYIHHPIPSRHHYIFEELSKRHEVHVAHFHVSRGRTQPTNLIVDEATKFPVKNPLLHYTLNAPYHFYRLNKLVKDNDIDIVVAAHVLAGTAAIRAARKNDIPVLFDLKDWFPDSAAAYIKKVHIQDIVRWSVLQITKLNLTLSDGITTVSPSLVTKLGKLGYSAGLITNGVDTSIFKPLSSSKYRNLHNINQKDFVIGFVGSVEKWYAIDELIRALPELIRYNPNTRLLIVGDSLFTGYKYELTQLAQSLGVERYIRFTGTKPYNELPGYIACMDVCTIPLSPPQWIDIALPNKFFEYSACGKAIVATPMPDVIKLGGNNLFIYHNKDEYINHIKYLMKYHMEFNLNVEQNSWVNKAKLMETMLIEMRRNR
jgi:phosphatidyl-myo-inositol dimannoside synthase